MSEKRKGRRPDRRSLRPCLDDVRLEPRVVLSSKGGHAPFVVNQYLLTHPQAGFAFKLGKPPFRQGSTAHPFGGGPVYTRGYAKVQTIAGGAGVEIATPDGSHFRVHLELADATYDGGLTAQTGSSGTGVVPSTVVQPVGTVRAYPTPGGKVGIIVDGTTSNMQLVIDPLPFPQRPGYAHSFAYGQAGREHILDISSLTVMTGQLNAVLGYRTARLSGPLTIGGNGVVDRIALSSLEPGAAIGVGGSLNTLDILKGINLNSGPGISIGRDLNLLNVGNDINLSNGASLLINRDIGAVLQPPKGSGTGSNVLSLNIPTVTNGIVTAQLQNAVGAYILGNVNIGPGSTWTVARYIDQQVFIGGNLTGAARFNFNVNPQLIASGTPGVRVIGTIS